MATLPPHGLASCLRSARDRLAQRVGPLTRARLEAGCLYLYSWNLVDVTKTVDFPLGNQSVLLQDDDGDGDNGGGGVPC